MDGDKWGYEERWEKTLVPLASELERHIRQYVNCPRIDRIAVRAKGVDKFIKKAQKLEYGKPKYSNPLSQIQDQIGARIITFYLADVPSVCEIIETYFRKIEDKFIVPDSEKEFGYTGRHFILRLPTDLTSELEEDSFPEFFELQVKTLFQHAWSEAEHDLGYKPCS